MKKLILCVLFVGLFSACPVPGPVQPPLNAAIDCLGKNRPAIDTLLNEFRPLLSGGQTSWPSIKERGRSAGMEIGTCFVMELANWYLSGTRSNADATLAYETAKDFRATVGKGLPVVTNCVADDGSTKVCRL